MRRDLITISMRLTPAQHEALKAARTADQPAASLTSWIRHVALREAELILSPPAVKVAKQ